MKMRYLILSLLLVLALITAGCTDDNGDEGDDIIGDDDDTGDDDDSGDDDDPGDYALLTIKVLSETPYSYNDKLVQVKSAKVISVKTGYSCTISDDSTTETITLYGYKEDMGLKAGNILDIKGTFTQYKNQYWEIKIRTNTDDKVTVTGTESVTYTTITINELLTNAESSIGLLIAIKDAEVTDKESFYKFHISDDTSSDKLFVYNDGLFLQSFKKGDTIDIQGEFMKYNDEWELKLRNNTDDGITKVTGGSGGDDETYDTHTVAELLGDTASYQDKPVKVENAEVTYVKDSWSFKISDSSTEDELTVYGGSTTVNVGDNVKVQGQFFYYDSGGYWEIKIRKDTKDSVTVISEAAPITYTTLTISELLGTPETYNGTDVKVESATIVTLDKRDTYLKINITDSSSSDTLILYIPNDADHPTGLAVNDIVNVQGEFKWWYSGYWEIAIRTNEQDKVEAAA